MNLTFLMGFRKICNSDPHRTVERVTDLLNLGVLQSVIHILFIHLDSRAGAYLGITSSTSDY